MENGRIKRCDKSRLSEYNLEEIRGWIINQMYNIEFNIDLVITDHFDPSKRDEFRKIILNSSIVTIGGKLKILRNIKSFDKKIIGYIQDLSTIRNAFAHLPVTERVNLKISEDENGALVSPVIPEIISQIQTMTSSGELKMKNANEMINDFFDKNEQIREYLLSNDYNKQ